jgi:hypothetical protein
MSPEQLALVCESWADLSTRGDSIADRLAQSYGAVVPAEMAAQRARWLVHAVTELVGLLTSPSLLAGRARELAQSLPASDIALTFTLDGNAWMCAGRDLCPLWTEPCEQAWRGAWLLLSDVVANESLSPFAASPSAFAD